MRNELPETCFATLPGMGDLIILKRGETGYYRSDWDTGDKSKNQELADFLNRRSGITLAQVEAMLIGSMCGFHVPGANPQHYFDNARYVSSHSLHPGTVLCVDDSSHKQVGGTVYQYQITGETCSYLNLASLPESIMGIRSEGIILLDMVQGEPLVPVTLKWTESGGCEMTLDHGAFTHGKEVNADYQIVAKVCVGPVEYALGEMDGKFPFFVTWERTPANDGSGPPNYYWGHYFDRRDEAIKDFCDRASEKYKMLLDNRKPSLRAQLAAAEEALVEKPDTQRHQQDKGAR